MSAEAAAIELAMAVVAPLVSRLAEWQCGRAPEPPELVHLTGISESEKAAMRQRAEAAARLN